MNKEIILASASPRRKELLNQIGLSFRVTVSSAAEKTQSKEPSRMVQDISYAKAQAVFESLPVEKKECSVVIGADTMVSFGGRMLGKPMEEKEAYEMLLALQGHPHQVYTGVAMIWQEPGNGGNDNTRQIIFAEETAVTLYPMSHEEITGYIATGEPMDKAGAYGIQGKCAAWVKKISGDYSNVVGLPVGRLYQELKKIGI